MSLLALDTPRRARRPSLTPMIDVVFLLLVFFMLAARFGTDRVVDLTVAGASAGYQGPPRLVSVLPEGLLLNGMPVSPDTLPEALRPLMDSPTDVIILRPQDGAEVQVLIDVITGLRNAGLTQVAVVP